MNNEPVSIAGFRGWIVGVRPNAGTHQLVSSFSVRSVSSVTSVVPLTTYRYTTRARQ